MLGAILVLSGLVAVPYGLWRGYLAARSAVVPFARDGDPTRSLIDASRPVHDRRRVRLAVRNVLLAVAWLTVVMYGLYLAVVGTTVLR